MSSRSKDHHVTTAAMSFAKEYLEYLQTLTRALDLASIAAFAEALLAAREADARIFFIGNGGSAATAMHFANDIAFGTSTWTKPFRAQSLCDNVAVLTAIANDYGYEHVFVAQLRAHLSPDDVVVAISASGNSPNVVKAVEYANANGATTIALTGFDGGQLRKLAKISVHVPTPKGKYGPVEDVHMILDHLMGAFLTKICSEGKGE